MLQVKTLKNHDFKKQKKSPSKDTPVLDHPNDDLFYVLDQLKNSHWTGNKALEMIHSFLQNKEDDQVSFTISSIKT